MASVDLVIPSYAGLKPETHNSVVELMRASNCHCGTHPPWRCPRGMHSVRLVPSQFGGSVVHWTRNQVVSLALFGPQEQSERPPAEYLLLMDDDMTPKPGDLNRLLAHQVDIAVGICTVRRDPPRPNIRYWNEATASFEVVTEWDWNSPKLFPIDAAGAAFMLVKRQVFERMAAAFRQCVFQRDVDKRRFPGAHEEIDRYWDARAEKMQKHLKFALDNGLWSQCDSWWFTFASDAHDEQVGEFGEDLSFCWKAKQLGYKIYADPQVTPGHLGYYAYSVADHRDWLGAQQEIGERTLHMQVGRPTLFEPPLEREPTLDEELAEVT